MNFATVGVQDDFDELDKDLQNIEIDNFEAGEHPPQGARSKYGGQRTASEMGRISPVHIHSVGISPLTGTRSETMTGIIQQTAHYLRSMGFKGCLFTDNYGRGFKPGIIEFILIRYSLEDLKKIDDVITLSEIVEDAFDAWVRCWDE